MVSTERAHAARSIRRPSVVAIFSVISGAIIALTVLLSGTAIGHADIAATTPPSPPLDPVTGVDIRDSVIANGPVTPWMEQQSAQP